METWEWNRGRQCEMWGVPLVCLFRNLILVNIVAPLQLGLGIHNPPFVAGPTELGLGTRNLHFVLWPLRLGLGTRSPRVVAWPLELGLGIRNARSTIINHSTVFALHCFVLPCVPIKVQGVGLLHFTCIFLRFFGKWITEADILEFSREPHSMHRILWTHPPLPTLSLQTVPSSLWVQFCCGMHVVIAESSSQRLTGNI